jgi:hypothetical protein
MPLKIIAFYEDYWMPPGTDHAQWDHLCRAYGAELQMIRDWSEANISPNDHVVLIDEAGGDEIPHLSVGNSVFIFGRSAQDLTTTIPEDEWDASYVIRTPNNTSLFGISAASIVLDRYSGTR